MMTIIIRSVFEEDGKLYPEVFLDDTLYELSNREYGKNRYFNMSEEKKNKD